MVVFVALLSREAKVPSPHGHSSLDQQHQA
jgi:hypothetical protein